MNSLVDTRTDELVRLRNHFQAGGNLLRATVWSFVWFRNFRIYLRLDRSEVTWWSTEWTTEWTSWCGNAAPQLGTPGYGQGGPPCGC